MMKCIFSHINRRTQFENPVLEAKRRLEQQRQMQSQGLSALPLPTIYRGMILSKHFNQIKILLLHQQSWKKVHKCHIIEVPI